MTTKNEKDPVAEVEKEAATRRLLRKLEERARLRALADIAEGPKTMAEFEVSAVRDYLDQWATWMQRDQFGGEYPHASSFVEEGRSWEHSILDPLDVPNLWAIKIVDAAMIELAGVPGGLRMRVALQIRWLNENVDAAVFRSSRVSLDQVDDIADAAERALIPMLKRRGLPLG